MQILTIDTNGSLFLRLVARLSKVEVEGSEDDFGLRVGGRIRLLQTGEVEIVKQNPGTFGAKTLSFADLPTDHNQIVEGTDTGHLLR